jgi:hypothetical protein
MTEKEVNEQIIEVLDELKSRMEKYTLNGYLIG